MKPLTNDQISFFKYVDDMNKRHIPPPLSYLDAAKAAFKEAKSYGDWRGIIYFQGILDYLTWPKVG